MNFLFLLPASLSLVVLAAHFLRTGNLLLVLLILALIPLLALRRRWVRRAVQVVLVLGALEWLRTLLVLVHFRMMSGEPFGRMVVILGTVALFTALSALLFQTGRLRRRYTTSARAASAPAGEPAPA